MMAPLPYYCIHCGNEEPQVYKTYAEGNLIKLLKCTNCSELVDSYCEFDATLLSINIILQNKKAYRHILLNTCFENFWKLGVVFLFCESYSFWCFQKGMEYKTNYADFYELEVNFYRVLLRTALSTITFDGSVLLLSWMSFKLFRREPPKCFSLWTLWKGLCLCRYAVLFELVPLIWSYTNAQPRILIVYGIFILSNLQSYEERGTGNCTTRRYTMSGEAILSQRLNPISWIIGTWQSSSAAGEYPSIKPFQYIETIEFSQVGAQPLLKYTGTSRHPQSGNPMHQETGFLRVRGENELSFMVAHNFGLSTVEEGVAENHKIFLKTPTSNIARMSPDSAKPDPGIHVTELERKFILDSTTGELTQEIFMATEKVPQLTSHLRAVYQRKDDN